MRRSLAVLLTCALLRLAVTGASAALEAGTLPLRPGETLPQPRQRRLTDIEALPTTRVACPACDFSVAVPLVDALMLRNGGGDAPEWRMDAAERDADLCPYPAPGMVDFQADIVLCPVCGYANRAEAFPLPLEREAVGWIFSSLRPAIIRAKRELLGESADSMTEGEIAAFFNKQELLPDTIRTEHYRAYLMANHAPALLRAEACLLAAWAARREAAAPPKGAFLAARAASVLAALERDIERDPKKGGGAHGKLDALRSLLRRRTGGNALSAADRMAGRVMLAGMYQRLGFPDEAETTLRELYAELNERYLRHEQDPLWSAVAKRGDIARSLTDLEIARSESEREVLLRIDMTRLERELLLAAADCVRDAFRNGELTGRPEQALFQAYMMGEALRRAGDLPLASEWYKNLASLAAADSPLARAVAMQLALVDEGAGDEVNLLSALGRDGDLFERLRAIGMAGRILKLH